MVNSILFEVISLLKFEAMAIGALGAYLVYHAKKEISSGIIFSIPAQLVVFGLLFLRRIGQMSIHISI